MNELVLSSTNAPAKFSFKNAQLNKISAKIAEQSAAMNSVYNAAKEGAEAVNKALAPLFGELMASKCYKDDGFKSVADYAEHTFGMSKSMAYMLARVGEAFYNTGSEDAKLARETLSTSKLAELTGTDKKEVSDAIKSGELTADAPLATCREFAASHKKPGKEKVVQTFDLYAMKKDGGALLVSNIMKEEFLGVLSDAIDKAGKLSFGIAYIKLDGDKASAAQHGILYDSDGGSRMFEYRPHVTPKKAKKTSGDKFDLASYIASLSPDERKALADMVSSNG